MLATHYRIATFFTLPFTSPKSDCSYKCMQRTMKIGITYIMHIYKIQRIFVDVGQYFEHLKV